MRRVPDDHSEFGAGGGLIDPETRRDRTGLTADERRMEIVFTDPLSSGADGDPARVDVPRLAVDD